MEQAIRCPSCGMEIGLDEALMAPVQEKVSRQFRESMAEKEESIRELKERLEKTSEESEKLLKERLNKERKVLRKEIEEGLLSDNRLRLEDMERRLKEKDDKIKESVMKELELLRIKEDLEEKERNMDRDLKKKLEVEKASLRQDLEADILEKHSVEIRDMEERLKEKEKSLDEARERELDLRKRQRDLEEKERSLEIDVARRLDKERKEMERQFLEKSSEEHRLKDAEKEKTIRDLKDQIEVLRQRAELGSQQLQGEVLELELQEVLAHQFPFDDIEEVKKGQRGADIIQKVRTNTGFHCGTIIWETKRAKNWSGDWLPKLKDDMKEARADVAVLCSTTLPKDLDRFSIAGDVVVTSTAFALPVAALIREQVIRISRERSINEGMSGKKDLLYTYLTGPEFRQNMEGMVEAFLDMKGDLDSEKASLSRIWAKREKQMLRALSNLGSIYGSMQGIAGASLPSIKDLEIERIPERTNGCDDGAKGTLDGFSDGT